MTTKYYTGVGSRQAPPAILTVMTTLAHCLAAKGWVLRSGGADGADTAFEAGAGARKEIYLPAKGFKGNPSPLYLVLNEDFRWNGRKNPNKKAMLQKESPLFGELSVKAMGLAGSVHPAWDYLKPFPRRLHARNSFQVLGQDLATPSRFLVCWTRDGAYTEAMCSRDTGGTGTAIKLAERHGIEVFNLAQPEHCRRIQSYLENQTLTTRFKERIESCSHSLSL